MGKNANQYTPKFNRLFLGIAALISLVFSCKLNKSVPAWSGQYINKQENGYGVRYKYRTSGYEVYKGEMQEGKFHGKGIYYGELVKEGEWNNGKFQDGRIWFRQIYPDSILLPNQHFSYGNYLLPATEILGWEKPALSIRGSYESVLCQIPCTQQKNSQIIGIQVKVNRIIGLVQ